ncbi:MAG: 30S ribosomal protein S20 [Verrucomicrobiae bacterium]|nr:30S ribosomal protein S20 [Verrucomicrobiae bacterium]MDW8309283.1 30S ribosomal protein S20 [Verrucomicrobiales bacterium]
MPNTKSAARRMRANERRRVHNLRIRNRLRRLEKTYRKLLGAGNRDEAVKLLRDVTSAYDKAVKSGVVHWATANRKKSRLTTALNRVTAAARAKAASAGSASS